LSEADQKKAQGLLKEPGHVQLRKLFPFYDLSVCVGAQVMVRNNTMMEVGIFNGTMGLVTAVDRYTIQVRFWVGDQFEKDPRPVPRAIFTVPVGEAAELAMTQYPLTLAYACTIHKVQGLTLDSIRLDARSCWEPGQLYTALSRVRRLEDLFLHGFDVRSLLVDPVAIAFESVV
jgi:ATP-dependent exoDNAse (exonuclease V) alpha subunit